MEDTLIEAVYTVNGWTWMSLLAFSFGVCWFVLPLAVRWIRRRPNRDVRERFHVLMFSTLVAVVLFEVSKTGETGPTPLVRMLQAFTTDADYDFMASWVQSPSKGLSNFMKIYRAVLYTGAPLLGAAFVYDVFAGLSPKIRLQLNACFRTLYVFSELNARSVALAEDIVRMRPDGNGVPALVFTDCYVNSSDECASELLMRARDLHAICIEEDIQHLRRIASARKCRYFLIDTTDDGAFDDESNLICAQYLFSREESKRKKSGRAHKIYFFSDDSATIERLCALEIDRRAKQPESIPVHVVRDYALACCEQLQEKPLFLALPKKKNGKAKKGRALRVAIWGEGLFAREMFKTVFWCGQLLEHPLQITVIGSAGKAEFIRWLNSVSPELLKSCVRGHSILNARLDGGPMPPYASLDYVDRDSADLRSLLEKKRQFFNGSREEYQLKDSDYFLVMGDGDLANVRLAEELTRCLCLRNRERGESSAHQIVAAVVESEELQALTQKLSDTEGRKNGQIDRPEFVCFGALSARFRWENIARESRISGGASGKGHGAGNIYDDWSSFGRAAHLPYKMFSLCGETDNGPEARIRYWNELDRDLAQGGELAGSLTWLEHRRWCAFMRCLGFTQPPSLKEYLKKNEEYLKKNEARIKHNEEELPSWSGIKDIRARTHPNLVECAEKSMTKRTEKSGEKDLLEMTDELRKRVPQPKKQTSPAEEAKKTATTALWERAAKVFGKKAATEEPTQEPTEELTHPHSDRIPQSIKQYDIPFGKYAPRLSEGELREWLSEEQLAQLASCRVTVENKKWYYLDLIQKKDLNIYNKLGKAN